MPSPEPRPRTVVEAPLPKLQVLAELQRRAARLDADRAAAARRQLLERCPTPADLAVEFDPNIVRTPAFDLIGRRWAQVIPAYDGRLTISMGPQQGKSVLSRWAIFWALLDNPDRRIVFASYGMALARTSGRIIRNMVDTHGAAYGLTLDQAHHDASDWQLAGFEGGVLCAGVGSSLTGRPSDLMVIDDLLAGQAEADSETVRSNVAEWWETVARTRMAPGTSAIAIGTRWHPEDILSRFIAEGWERINIPALADGDTLDSLDRPAGEWLTSTRGTTVADWEQVRAEVGERAFAALYQGRPAPLEGGIFRRAWFEQHRVVEPPELARTVVAVDPADTGTGDAAGILVGARGVDGHLYVLADLSGPLSRGQWARRVCVAVVRYGASTVVSERTLGMQTAVAEGWAVIRRQAVALRTHGDVPAAVAALLAAGDDVAADAAQLAEVAALGVDDVLSRPSQAPCRTVVVTPRQSKHTRAEAVTVFYETGRAHHVGTLAELEFEATTWQVGQPSPNRLDTLAHLLPHLEQSKVDGRASVARARPGAGVPTSTGRDPRRGGMPRGLVRTLGGVG